MAPPNPKVVRAFNAMRDIGIPVEKVKPVLKKLLKLYNNNWELIEEENYRVLADAIFDGEGTKVVEQNKSKKVDVEDFELKGLTHDESPLKRLRLRGQEGPFSSSHNSYNPRVAENSFIKPKEEEDEMPSTYIDPQPQILKSTESILGNARTELQPGFPQIVSHLPVSPLNHPTNKGKQNVSPSPLAVHENYNSVQQNPADRSQPCSRKGAESRKAIHDSERDSDEVHAKDPTNGPNVISLRQQKVPDYVLVTPKDEPFSHGTTDFEVPIAVVYPDSSNQVDSSAGKAPMGNPNCQESAFPSIETENRGDGLESSVNERPTNCENTKETTGKRASSNTSWENHIRDPTKKRHSARCRNAPFIKERGVSLQQTSIKNQIFTRHWGAFVEDPGYTIDGIVREFYENMPSIQIDVINVRGVDVTFTAKEVNKYFQTPDIDDDEDWEASVEYTTELVLSTICGGAPKLLPDAPSLPTHFENKYLIAEAKVWYHLISRRLLPNTAFNKVFLHRAKMICALMRGARIDIGKAMVKAVWKARRNTRSGLACPSLITAICLRHKVEVKSTDEKTPCETSIHEGVFSTFVKSANKLGLYRSRSDSRALILVNEASQGDEDNDEEQEGAEYPPEPSFPPPSSSSARHSFSSSYDFSSLDKKLDYICDKIKSLNTCLDSNHAYVAQRFDDVAQRLDDVAQRLDDVAQRFDEEHKYNSNRWNEDKADTNTRWNDVESYLSTHFNNSRNYQIRSNEAIFRHLGIPPSEWPQWDPP